MNLRRLVSYVLLIAAVLSLGRALLFAIGPAITPVSLSAADVAYTQNFDALASSGTSSVLPTGWGFDETGSSAAVNGLYTAGTGSGNGGDVYSFGATASTERAFGTLQSGTLAPMIGARFTNTSSSTFHSLDVSYFGEMWRSGGRTPVTIDRLDFQISLDATSLTNGTWFDVDALDLNSPAPSTTAGALKGDANRVPITATISAVNNVSLDVPPGASFSIRWKDFDITPGADDGLAIDDFSLTPRTTVVTPLSGTAHATPTSVTAGDPVTLSVTVTPATNPASTGIVVTADLSPIGGSSIQPFLDDGLNGDAVAGDNTFTFAATVDPATSGGNKSLSFAISDAQSRTAAGAIALAVARPLTPIHDIQGSGSVSPLTGEVTTVGIITGVKSNGFFLQADPADYDLNPNTSEGVFVFTSFNALPNTAVVGNRVKVTGTVSEFGTAGDPVGLSATELTTPTVEVLATGQPLPPAITLTNTDLFPGASFLQLEKYEGMRVHLDTVVSVTPTDGTVNEASATSTTTGLLFAVLPGTARPFREPGIQTPLPVPPEAPVNAIPPVFDGNYEHVGVDTYAVFLKKADAQDNNPPTGTLEVTTGVTVANVTGPLDYSFRLYIVDTEHWQPPVALTGNVPLTAVSTRHDGEFSVASFNMERFFDTVNDAGISDVALTQLAFDGRLNKASLAIRNVLHMPDILGVEEVENLTALEAVAAKVNADAIAHGEGDPQYHAFLVEGNDIGGIDSGLLVRADRVDLAAGHYSVTQYGKDTTYTDPTNNSQALLNDRPPLVLEAKVFNPPFEPYPVTVIVNHLRSLSGIDGSDGPRIRAKRRAQADYLAGLIRGFQQNGQHVVSVGDYNAFDVNDGYVDVIGIVRGDPAPANEVTVTTHLTPAQLPNPTLVDAISFAPANQRYSFVFDGNAQELDHVLLTPDLLVSRVEYGRMDADFPESYRGDFNRPERLSDHDPIVVFFHTPDVDTVAPVLNLPDNLTVEGNTAAGANVTYTVTAFDAADGVITPVCAPPSGSLFAVTTTKVTCTATDAHGNFSTGFFTVTVTDTTAPVVRSTIATPAVLWPPNKAMRPVDVIIHATDIVSGTQSRIVGITGNDGATAADWEITGALSARLRADRTGEGSGRTYTLTVETRDASGNTTVSQAVVFVPHDQGK